MFSLYIIFRLQIESTVFKDSKSQDRGGAISAVGAVIMITNTRFVNCSSLGNGGGAILATNFECYAAKHDFSTAVNIIGSSFEGCFSRGSGGAVLVDSNLAKISVTASSFTACRSESQGGAISSIDGSLAKIVDSVFSGNSAGGHGGGALYAENAQLILHGVSANDNRAEAGGGGVLYWLGQVSPTVISWCRPGSYPDPAFECKPDSCSAACIPCQQGKYLSWSGADSQENCLPCEAGSYSSSLGSSHCGNQCGAGFFSTMRGAADLSVCAACEPGTFTDISGATTCHICEAGAYSSGVGSSACLLCPPATYLTSPGASALSACMMCQGGSFSQDKGSVYCSPCDAGYYSRPMSTACTECPAGTFASEHGSAECDSCRPGQFSDQGAASCSVCWAGTFSTAFSMNGSAGCRTCGDGLFSGREAERCNPINGYRAGIASDVFSNGSEVSQSTVSLPFSFSWYGEEYWNVTISKYGVLGMGECILSGPPLFHSSFWWQQSLVAVFWQNLALLNLDTPFGNGLIQWSDKDTVVFQWTNWSTASWAGTGGSLTFQISLLRNGSVLLSYVQMDGLNSRGDFAVVGFKGHSRLGRILSFFSPTLHSGLCFRVSPDPTQASQYSIEEYTCPENIRLVPICGPGLFLGSDYQCTACRVGTYQTGEGMQSVNNCSLCATGKFSPSSGATAASSCMECAVNNSKKFSLPSGCDSGELPSDTSVIRSIGLDSESTKPQDHLKIFNIEGEKRSQR
jgi:predicted outer membrane repeat protein